MGIIAGAIGVSSNGRTRDFGSLYHGSNPCAPTKNKLLIADCIFQYQQCPKNRRFCGIIFCLRVRYVAQGMQFGTKTPPLHTGRYLGVAELPIKTSAGY